MAPGLLNRLYGSSKSTPSWTKEVMIMKKNGLFRFYLLFMLLSLALFSCENHDLTIDSQQEATPTTRRHPVDPNVTPTESPTEVIKGKKIRRNHTSRSRTWC